MSLLLSSADRKDIDNSLGWVWIGTKVESIYAGGHITTLPSDYFLERLTGIEHEYDMIKMRQYFQGTFERRHIFDVEFNQPAE